MDNFARCFGFTLDAEGGFSDVTSDPGNWTGGIVGHGALRGTKFGISAAAYPGLDIENLSVTDAEEIYRRDFFETVYGDELALPLAMAMFDGAVNAGVKRAVCWLQQALGRPVDGIFGAETLAAVKAADSILVAREILTRRIDFYSRLGSWTNFGLGWTRRVISLAAEMLGQ